MGGNALETTKNRLASAYRRRAACATLGVALMTVGIVSPSMRLWAQGTPQDSKQTPDPGKADKPQKDKDKSGTIRVIPMPRKDQPGRAAAPPAGTAPAGLPAPPSGTPLPGNFGLQPGGNPP